MNTRALEDDPTVLDNDRLFRRIHLTQFAKDDDTGLARVSSGALKHDEMSVDIESVLISRSTEVASCLRDWHAHKLVSLRAGDARKCEQAVLRDPLPENPAHGLVAGKKGKRAIECLKNSLGWVIPDSAPTWAQIELEKSSHGL